MFTIPPFPQNSMNELHDLASKANTEMQAGINKRNLRFAIRNLSLFFNLRETSPVAGIKRFAKL